MLERGTADDGGRESGAHKRLRRKPRNESLPPIENVTNDFAKYISPANDVKETTP
jgi:hypothetical protein